MDVFGLLIVLTVLFMISYALYLLFAIYKESNKVNPYFGRNKAKEEYLDALDSNPPLAEEKLKHLLFKRAIEAMMRSKVLQDEKPSMTSLNNAGALSEELLKSFQSAEKETAEEIFEIKTEAELIKEGWSQDIFPEASVFLKKQAEVAPNARSSPQLAPQPTGLPMNKKTK